MEITLLDSYLAHEISLEDLALLNNVCKRTLMKRLKALNVKTHYQQMKESVNHNFFSNILTEVQAYWLGFWVADGNMRLEKKNHMFSTALSQKDEHHLQKLRHLLCPKHALNKTPTVYKKNGQIRSNPMCSISFCSKQIFDDLINLGYSERKTYKSLHLPPIPSHLIMHFIRGYSDGDGCISHGQGIRANGYSYNNANFNITSKTRSLLDEISQELVKYDLSPTVTEYVRKKRSHYSLSISGLKNIKKLYSILYKDAETFLERKKHIFESF